MASGEDRATVAIEDAFVAHWSVFGRWQHGSLHTENGVIWFETPIPHLPYNMVMRTRIAPDADAAAIVNGVAERFRRREVPYLWAHHPADTPVTLPHLLAREGLDLVETVTGMDLDLTDWQPQGATTDTEILGADDDPAAFHDYIELIRTYWSVPESGREMLEAFNSEYAGERAPGFRLLARLGGHAVGKLFVNTTQVTAHDRVSVYGVAVRPEARGHGVATALMEEAIVRAKALGAHHCVLHSSEMAVSLYRRIGFRPCCTIHAYATGPVFGTHHH